VALDMNEQRPDLDTLAAVIARSQIVWRQLTIIRHLPTGFEKADIAILNWISAEGRRVGHSFAKM